MHHVFSPPYGFHITAAAFASASARITLARSIDFVASVFLYDSTQYTLVIQNLCKQIKLFQCAHSVRLDAGTSCIHTAFVVLLIQQYVNASISCTIICIPFEHV